MDNRAELAARYYDGKRPQHLDGSAAAALEQAHARVTEVFAETRTRIEAMRPGSAAADYALNNPTGRGTLLAEYRALGIDPWSVADDNGRPLFAPPLPVYPPRFTIRRLPVVDGVDYSRKPWCITDRERPWWIGRTASHARAVARIDEALAAEHALDAYRPGGTAFASNRDPISGAWI